MAPYRSIKRGKSGRLYYVDVSSTLEPLEEVGELCTYSELSFYAQIPRHASDRYTVGVWLKDDEVAKETKNSSVALEVRDVEDIPNFVKFSLYP